MSSSKVMIDTTVIMVSKNIEEVKMSDEKILLVSIRTGKEKRSYAI